MRDSDDRALWLVLPSSSFLEYAFLRWILAPAALPEIASHVVSQAQVEVDGRRYFVDYEFRGKGRVFAIELDGFEFHGNRQAFTYDGSGRMTFTLRGELSSGSPMIRSGWRRNGASRSFRPFFDSTPGSLSSWYQPHL